MALKQVKNYYKQVEKLYFELASELKEMEDDFKKGECTEEELQNLLIPVNNIKENYQRLAYIMFLFYQPNKEKRAKKHGFFARKFSNILNNRRRKGRKTLCK